MTYNAHATALVNLLDADNNPPALVVIAGKVPPGMLPPYVRVYVHVEDPDDAESRPITGASQRVVARAICHCVGGDDIAARAVAQRVRAAYLDVVPTVAGRVCLPIRHEASNPPVDDESTGTLVVDQVDTYRLESLPA